MECRTSIWPNQHFSLFVEHSKPLSTISVSRWQTVNVANWLAEEKASQKPVQKKNKHIDGKELLLLFSYSSQWSQFLYVARFFFHHLVFNLFHPGRAFIPFLFVFFSLNFLFRNFPFALFFLLTIICPGLFYRFRPVVHCGWRIDVSTCWPMANRSAYRTLISIIRNENNLPGFVHYGLGISLDFSSTTGWNGKFLCVYYLLLGTHNGIH